MEPDTYRNADLPDSEICLKTLAFLYAENTVLPSENEADMQKVVMPQQSTVTTTK